MLLNWTEETKKMFPRAYKFAQEHPQIFDEIARKRKQREEGTLPEEPDEGVDQDAGTMAWVFAKKPGQPDQESHE